MTDTRMARAYPDLSEGQALMALLSETLEIARDLETTHRDLKAAKGDALDSLIASAGLPEEIEAAGRAAQATALDILNRVSEEDLESGPNAGLLTPDDFTDALKAKRTMSLARGRSSERENEREA